MPCVTLEEVAGAGFEPAIRRLPDYEPDLIPRERNQLSKNWQLTKPPGIGITHQWGGPKRSRASVSGRKRSVAGAILARPRWQETDRRQSHSAPNGTLKSVVARPL